MVLATICGCALIAWLGPELANLHRSMYYEMTLSKQYDAGELTLDEFKEKLLSQKFMTPLAKWGTKNRVANLDWNLEKYGKTYVYKKTLCDLCYVGEDSKVQYQDKDFVVVEKGDELIAATVDHRRYPHKRLVNQTLKKLLDVAKEKFDKFAVYRNPSKYHHMHVIATDSENADNSIPYIIYDSKGDVLDRNKPDELTYYFYKLH